MVEGPDKRGAVKYSSDPGTHCAVCQWLHQDFGAHIYGRSLKVALGYFISALLSIVVLSPFAVAYLVWSYAHGSGHVFMQSVPTDALLLATGVITVLPLWWYSQAARQLSVIALGFLQFVPPSCNFLLAVLVYHESLPTYRAIAFALIWAGLAVFMGGAVVKQRTAIRAAAAN